jgi:SepF-like predicted cell division protein (DUF552 family)
MASMGLLKKVENMKFRMDTEGSHVESYLEVDNQAGARGKERILITGVKGVHSTTRIAQMMRDKRSLFLISIKDVAKNDEYRPCIERIKKDCRDHGYDMALVDNEWVMMIPKDSGIELESD